MIDKQTLKKHNLKAVPFSCIREGETFWFGYSLKSISERYERKLFRGRVDFVDGSESAFLATHLIPHTVYVPVWRVTEVVL